MNLKLIAFIDPSKFLALIDENRCHQFVEKYRITDEDKGTDKYFNSEKENENIIIIINNNGEYSFGEFEHHKKANVRIYIIPDDTNIKDFELSSEFYVLKHSKSPGMLDKLIEDEKHFKGLFEEQEDRGTSYEKLAKLIGDLENETDQNLKVEIIETFLFKLKGGKLEAAIKFLYNCLANNIDENVTSDLTKSNFNLDKNPEDLISRLFEYAPHKPNDDYVLTLRKLRDYLFLQCDINK